MEEWSKGPEGAILPVAYPETEREIPLLTREQIIKLTSLSSCAG